MSTITQVISDIPVAGHRGIDERSAFVAKQETFQDHLTENLVVELNELATQVNTVTSVADLSIYNNSTNIGSGALRFAASNYPAVLSNLNLNGTTCLDSGWNVFNNSVIGIACGGNGNQIAPYGSVGTLLSGTNLSGYRELAAHEIGITMVGSQSMTVNGISMEETPIGVVIGHSGGSYSEDDRISNYSEQPKGKVLTWGEAKKYLDQNIHPRLLIEQILLLIP